jgi:hypothetical protein
VRRREKNDTEGSGAAGTPPALLSVRELCLMLASLLVPAYLGWSASVTRYLTRTI